MLRVSVSRTARPRCSRSCGSSTREHLDPVTMALREPTLDDVFLELTGHTAEEPARTTTTPADERPHVPTESP